MTNNLSPAIKKIAWGYIFLYFNITIGPLDILPAWAGYLMIFSALPAAADWEPEAVLLRNPALILAAWSGFDWAFALLEAHTYAGGVFYSLYSLAGTAASVLAIYLHFQLLTNLAGAAAQLGLEDRQARFLRLRTINTVLQTVLAVYTAFPLPEITWLAVIILVVNLIVLVGIVITLFGFRKETESFTL